MSIFLTLLFESSKFNLLFYMRSHDPSAKYLWLHQVIFTSATKSEGGYVFTPLSLFVCLCVGYVTKLWTDSNESWWTGWVCDKEELIQFW